MNVEITYIPEPDLDFGRGRHPDIRYGILNYGPYDIRAETRPASITLGVVGTSASVATAKRWIESARVPVAPKASPKINLFAPFPGFSKDSPWQCDFVLSDRHTTTVAVQEIETLMDTVTDLNERIERAVALFLDALRNAAQRRPDVLVLALPLELLAAVGEDDSDETVDVGNIERGTVRRSSRNTRPRHLNFHDMLKARAIPLGIPLQLLRPSTCDPKLRRREKDWSGRPRQRQDDATCAWNFFVALYYKSGGYPWRLLKQESDLTICYIGVSFFESLDKANLQTAVAQVFDERGHGMIVKGGLVTRDPEDRAPHLDAAGMHALLTQAIECYRREHRTNPARVAVHKSSTFNAAELDGARTALAAFQIPEIDLLSLDRSLLRLARNGYYPPLRGACWALDADRTLLYTNGSVQLYEEYPGLYVPRTLLIRHDKCTSDRHALAAEILALTKMNWNNAQITALEPITLRAARQVARILKYADSSASEAIYSFFM